MGNIASDKRRSSKVLHCKTASVKFSLVAGKNCFVSNETIKEKFNEFCFRILNTTWNRWLYWLMSGSMRSLQRKSEERQGENFPRVSHCQMSPIHSIQRYTCIVFSLPLVISLNVISSISMIFPVLTYKYTYKLCLNSQLFEHFYLLLEYLDTWEFGKSKIRVLAYLKFENRHSSVWLSRVSWHSRTRIFRSFKIPESEALRSSISLSVSNTRFRIIFE